MEAGKEKQRRRSSFTARRVSIKVLPQDAGNQTEIPIVESVSEDASGGAAPQSACEFTPVHAPLESEIQRYTDECSEWDRLLARTEQDATAAKQKASEKVILRDEDVPKEVRLRADELIGQKPDYAAILQDLHHRANGAFAKLEEISCVMAVVEKVVQKTDSQLAQYADLLGELSLPNPETPRTQIRQRLDVSSSVPLCPNMTSEALCE